MTNEYEHQPYDTALKSLMEDHVAEMLPELIPGSEFVSEEKTEIVRNKLFPDLVLRMWYRDELHILDLELQTNTDQNMAYRMFLYHVGLLEKYERPVISMVIYPFETSIPEPVFREMSGEEVLLAFPHRVLRLWELDAEQYVRRRVVSMYTLLPAMRGANASLLLYAIDEMRQRYTGMHLARHLTRFRTILRRSKTLSEQDKQIVEDYMHTYDSLLEQDPEIQRLKAEKLAEGRILGIQEIIVDTVRRRFPDLVELAQQQVVQLNNLDDLNQLHWQIINARDEAMARWYLSKPVA